jgi:hypothetical protein
MQVVVQVDQPRDDRPPLNIQGLVAINHANIILRPYSYNLFVFDQDRSLGNGLGPRSVQQRAPAD